MKKKPFEIKVNLTKMMFETIDKVLEFPQNPKRLEKQFGDVECISDVNYSERFSDMALDLYYLPQEGKKYPVIFEIHGGGFSAGDKKYRRCLCRYYAKNTGAIVVNVNYGVGADAACPLPMQQLAEAVNWTVANAEKYNMDLSKFVVTGDSAGAFYACFLCVLQGSEFLQSLFQCKLNAKITAAVLNCGVYDMQSAMHRTKLLVNGVCKELMGMEVEEAVRSPYFEGVTLTKHVNSTFPETLLIYSLNDVFCKGQGEALLEKLQQNNVRTECVCAKSILDNHTYSLIWVTSMAKKTNLRILSFLNRHFGNESKSK